MCSLATGDYLEQFQEKWEPVFRPELRKDKEIEHFRDSKKNGNALAFGRAETAVEHWSSSRDMDRILPNLWAFVRPSIPDFRRIGYLRCENGLAAPAGQAECRPPVRRGGR
jgi:hypothetical protein